MIVSGARRRRAAALATLALGALLLSGCAADRDLDVQAPPQAEGALPEETVAQLQGVVESAMAATGAPGALVGVWAPWSGSWVSALGADATGGEISVEQGFRIGDLTRMMTCDVLYAVAAEGTVDLADPVSEYVAGAPDLNEVSLKQLCDGTSGLGSSQPGLQAGWISNPTRQWAPMEIAALGLGVTRSAPGAEYRDSDAGYQLLGLALERATGKTAAVLMDEYVFEPLGMTDTALPSARAAAPAVGAGHLPGYTLPRTAEGTWDCTAPIDISVSSASIGYTDSGVVSTLGDMGTYLRAVGAGAFTDQYDAADRYADLRPVAAGAPAWFTAGGGAIQAGSLVGQYGWAPGYISAGYVDPGTGMTVVVVLDSSVPHGATATYIAWQLAAIASKAPAADGFEAPQTGLPWTAEQYGEAVTAGSIGCP